MGQSFLQRVEKEVLAMSGATGTMLHGVGAQLEGCISQWVVDHPEAYGKLVRDYFQAGCQIVNASTATCNRIFLAKFGLAGKVVELNQGVVQIVKVLKPEGTFVGGSIGPTGKLLKPLGEVSVEELLDVFGQQAQVLAESGVEVIHILTMYDLEEAVAALRAAKKNTRLPVIVSMAFNSGAKGYRTMMGVSPEAAAERLEAEGADMIGTNCGGLSLDHTTKVLQLMKAQSRKPLIAKPNAGQPQVVDGQETYAAGPEQFAEHVGDWVQQGARIVSACCGSTPLHLQKMAEKVKSLDKNRHG